MSTVNRLNFSACYHTETNTRTTCPSSLTLNQRLPLVRSNFSVSPVSLFPPSLAFSLYSCRSLDFYGPFSQFAARSCLQLPVYSFSNPCDHAPQIDSRSGLCGPRQCCCRWADSGLCFESDGVGATIKPELTRPDRDPDPYNANTHQRH